MVITRSKRIYIFLVAVTMAVSMVGSIYAQDDDQTRNVLKQGLLGAGTGAIAAGTSGGKAGQGALVGAGTAVVGSALLDAITTPSGSSSRRRSAQPAQEDYYVDENGDEYYEEPAPRPQQSGSSQVLKQGLVGAGTGALAAGTSGGNAGQGALIGAGTAVIGNALLDAMTQPSQPREPRRVYRRTPQAQKVQAQRVNVRQETVPDDTGTSDTGRKKVVKKYDESGKLVSEEEVYY